MEYVTNPNTKLLATYLDAPRTNKIKQLIKPVKFLLSNPGTPSLGPCKGKRLRPMNLNVFLEGASRRSALGGQGSHENNQQGRRGSYNKNFSPLGKASHGPNDAFVFYPRWHGPIPLRLVLMLENSPDACRGILNASPGYTKSIAHSLINQQQETTFVSPNPRMDRTAIKVWAMNGEYRHLVMI